MKTANGTQLTLSPATATVLKNVLTGWINAHTPLSKYIEANYSDRSDNFKVWREKTVTERIVRLQMVIDQLEDTE